MSNYIVPLPSSLECLPNEILLEIFGYIQVHDRLRAFYNLNNRLNCILFASNVHLYILYPDDIQKSKINENILLHLIKSERYISRLRLIDDKSILNQKFIRFSFIRSLIVDIPTTKLISMITPELFSRLEYIHTGYSSAKINLDTLHRDIFSNGFPLLKKCSLNNISINQQWTGSPSIKILSVWSDNPRIVVERILHALTHLISFHLYLNWLPTHDILDNQIISQHSYLKCLKLHLYGLWTLEKLDSFLAYIPTITFLSLYSSYFDSHMISFQWDFKELAYIFKCRLPNLCRFNCEFIIKNQSKIDLKEIYSLHSCFHRINYEKYSDNELFIKIFTNK
ncbi:unnamed protein product [Adineta steineri]|uniref:F-box domain-containing protein n=1 Tax=Adineta steineri TaxID=433720 RepID=A0A813SEX2_9BILA|nr:unnamed protein product [Adineta steineri]CAF3965628.1 unnamed protein product [Adineta steineri]